MQDFRRASCREGVHNRDYLFEEFGVLKFKFIPMATESMYEFLAAHHPDAEFVTFSDLFFLKNKK